ncbi:MAG: hypothetical protein A2921_00075 [Candidatus Magasanikbacteria bacterium RIFCSPLOWO2_01_FULL_43_20b]|uniref:Uncharacterized protein n=1 Tax=Candidatus Magasanikbacteria bacterium RIFCSPLOWO2_12_FULL_43_12 TaxID=1798692 RepID=A0A1F6MTP9_9BACT|nr:MAG: hypothetical protein A3C74_00960 [Candidatus Magasanikbacteria bacterium RIFCSPHIGHO2_02_FULL_44_13]OGH72606.1 MAG: hypothetical protein A3I93_01635 [Candidatus Magasanikbacteria bacterium RIFCSPLOWO2_02_FULL_43_22]OGH72963.1 MAG: hypothetical protein A2921_00075 [Candidatus Magasanikbacteria bacterium RIFCSPLOWO2_01_FULL_43_20b]OGH75017.1 MAG: hypothetical protein A3G00_01540 [Candidatus Magasanikbacteria bacterium RIFCSPLOWO2_12_FULL_43_12]
MNYKTTGEFENDFKRLRKKYRTLLDDLDELKTVLEVRPLGAGKNFAVLARKKSVTIVKARLFCRSLKRNSLRIIYAFIRQSAAIEFIGIEFIELYFKGGKEREDRERIERYLNGVW